MISCFRIYWGPVRTKIATINESEIECWTKGWVMRVSWRAVVKAKETGV